MSATTEQIKELRDQTGISIMQCKKALEEAGGDVNKALIVLRKKGAEVAAKKAGRSLGAGIIAAYIHAGGTVGSMVELSCETDFVSGNEEFKKLAYDAAMHVAAANPEFLRMEDVAEEVKIAAREIFSKEAEGKAGNMKEKIIEGKLSAYFSERVLLNQLFIKNPEITVKTLVDNAVQKFGEKIEISRFVRFSTKS